jgi:hypothetical protein
MVKREQRDRPRAGAVNPLAQAAGRCRDVGADREVVEGSFRTAAEQQLRAETEIADGADGRRVVRDPYVGRQLEIELELLPEHPARSGGEPDRVAPRSAAPARVELDVLFHERSLCKDRFGRIGTREVTAPGRGRMQQQRAGAAEEGDGDD